MQQIANKNRGSTKNAKSFKMYFKENFQIFPLNLFKNMIK